MNEAFLIIIVVLTVINILVHFRKRSGAAESNRLQEIEYAILKFDAVLEKNEKSIRDEFQRNRHETNQIAKENREELSRSLKSFEDKFSGNTKDLNELIRQKFGDFGRQQYDLNKQSAESVKDIKDTIEKQLKAIREDNSQQLNEMRKTVDEKLQTTLEKRLGE